MDVVLVSLLRLHIFVLLNMSVLIQSLSLILHDKTDFSFLD